MACNKKHSGNRRICVARFIAADGVRGITTIPSSFHVVQSVDNDVQLFKEVIVKDIFSLLADAILVGLDIDGSVHVLDCLASYKAFRLRNVRVTK
jgi:hypothetical protein